MVLASILIILGLTRRQEKPYWVASACAVIFQFLFAYLMGLVGVYGIAPSQLSGTYLEAVWIFGVIAINWIIPIIIVRRYYVKKPYVYGNESLKNGKDKV
jgi:hypothetical protein